MIFLHCEIEIATDIDKLIELIIDIEIFYFL